MKRKLLLDFVNDDTANNDINEINDDDDASTTNNNNMNNEREILSLFSWSADNNPRLASQH
jgi:hypothetical protein